MNLGSCTFTAGLRGNAAMSVDGQSVVITPSPRNGDQLASLVKSLPEGAEQATALKSATGPATLSRVAGMVDGATLGRLAGQGLLKLGTWHRTGQAWPSKLFCHTSDGTLILAEFAAPGVPADAGK